MGLPGLGTTGLANGYINTNSLKAKICHLSLNTGHIREIGKL